MSNQVNFSDAEVEKMIELHMDFVNSHARVWRPLSSLITRADYDADEVAPKIIGDTKFYFYTTRRILTIQVDPYRDEGGPALLTGFFRGGPPDDDTLELDTLLFDFDTIHTIILLNGERTDAWPEEDSDGTANIEGGMNA